MQPAIDDLKEIIIEAAEQELLPAFARAERQRKTDGSIVTTADIAMQQRVGDELRRRWPELGFLGEEMDAIEQRRMMETARQGYWCLDPLDGTSNFAYGIPFFAVSLALLQQGEIKLGLVYDPVRKECFTARKGQGAALNGQPLLKRRFGLRLKQSIALIDFKRLPSALAKRLVTERPYGSQRSFGSVALDWCWIAAGRCHVYLHGKQKLWDYAAGSLVLEEAGGHAVTLEGQPVYKPALEARSAVAALDEDLSQEWLRFLGIAGPRQ